MTLFDSFLGPVSITEKGDSMSVIKLLPKEWSYDFKIEGNTLKMFLWIPELEKLMQVRIVKFEINAMFDAMMIKDIDTQRLMIKIWDILLHKEFKYCSITIRDLK